MASLRPFLAPCLAATLGACAIPNDELTSLLASQGIVSPSYVEHHRYTGSEGGWFVTTREQLRQIAPDVCTTHERYFAVYKAADSYRIEPGAVVRMIALKNCTSVRVSDLVSVGLPYRLGMVEPDIRELDDATLLKFLEAVFALPKMATTTDGEVRLHYVQEQEYELKALMRELNPRTLRELSISRTLDSMDAMFPINPKKGEATPAVCCDLSVRFRFNNNGRVTDIDLAAVVVIY